MYKYTFCLAAGRGHNKYYLLFLFQRENLTTFSSARTLIHTLWTQKNATIKITQQKILPRVQIYPHILLVLSLSLPFYNIFSHNFVPFALLCLPSVSLRLKGQVCFVKLNKNIATSIKRGEVRLPETITRTRNKRKLCCSLSKKTKQFSSLYAHSFPSCSHSLSTNLMHN